MMKGKYLLPLAVLGVAQCANAVFLVESFETGVYTPDNNNPGSKTTEQSQLHVTDGQFSMKVNDHDGGWVGAWKQYDASVYNEWFKNTKILVDVYYPARAEYQQIQFVVATNSDNGWDQKEILNWKWLNPGVDYKATLEWDYSADKDLTIPTSGWFQVWIMAEVPGHGGGLTHPFDIYVDNLRLDGAPVPEPMTLVALGGGLLVVAARRRR